MDWIFDFVAPNQFPEIAAATGAMLVGRRTDEVGDRMDANKERGHRATKATPSPDPRSSSLTGRLTRLSGCHVPHR